MKRLSDYVGNTPIIPIKTDKGITVWCEPIGDKSKLRKLRGIEIKT